MIDAGVLATMGQAEAPMMEKLSEDELASYQAARDFFFQEDTPHGPLLQSFRMATKNDDNVTVEFLSPRALFWKLLLLQPFRDFMEKQSARRCEHRLVRGRRQAWKLATARQGAEVLGFLHISIGMAAVVQGELAGLVGFMLRDGQNGRQHHGGVGGAHGQAHVALRVPLQRPALGLQLWVPHV